MRRWVLLLLLAGMSCALLAGCAATASGAESVMRVQPPVEAVPFDVEIREKLFVAQTNDVYANPDEYVGKVIRLEGIFTPIVYGESEQPVYLVVRYGPGCCGDDGLVGFEVAFDQERLGMPAQNDWVEAIGLLEWYEDQGADYLRLNLASLRVLDTRGAETVLQ